MEKRHKTTAPTMGEGKAGTVGWSPATSTLRQGCREEARLLLWQWRSALSSVCTPAPQPRPVGWCEAHPGRK